ncbi:DUF3040 domain-containing protein [Micropruina sonneratiae]|uniref:DUF3040 domain-containing protein n=1 Tax=Micropruina sonneratiae TaxID=2986940 RepID=UPI0022276989|nr:DUF3040 domain-containing protein [Micropruina sp. KQZ13P-5]MCW3157130.1 DUF3040 domain-containing protein [Micropruina sp. KQZ13P-5]
MALSEEEQRLLTQMEEALAAEDPKLASTLRGTTTRRLHRRRAAIAGVGFLIGIACLVGGMQVSPALSIVGFVIMLAASVVAITSWRHVGDAAASKPSVRSPQGEKAFMDKMEERWRRRQDEGQ